MPGSRPGMTSGATISFGLRELVLGIQVNSSSQKGRFWLSAGQTKTRRKRNLAIAFALVCGVLLIYAAAIFRFGAIIGNRLP